ncbi:hypothetical protein BJ742DRAFT_865061 [Cladochytrium replicatum]|nr:hypothetical protein BJ742DRAFT_865061 [Cladochytrium replicatum]
MNPNSVCSHCRSRIAGSTASALLRLRLHHTRKFRWMARAESHDGSGDRGGRKPLSRRPFSFETEDELEMYQKLMAKFLSSFEKVGNTQETWSDYAQLIESMVAKVTLRPNSQKKLFRMIGQITTPDEEGIDSKGEVMEFIVKNMSLGATAAEYAELIQLHQKQNHLDKIAELLAEMESKNIAANLSIFHTLMRICQKNKRPDVTLWLFLQISQNSNVEAVLDSDRPEGQQNPSTDDHRVYDSMRALCKGPYPRSPSNPISPTATSFELALRALVDLKHYDAADKLYRQMQKFGPHPHTSALNFMMITDIKNRNPRRATERFTDAAATQPHIQLSSRRLVVAAYAWAGDLERGTEALTELNAIEWEGEKGGDKDAVVEPGTAGPYNAMMRVAMRKRDVEAVWKVYRCMCKESGGGWRVQPPQETVSELFVLLCEELVQKPSARMDVVGRDLGRIRQVLDDVRFLRLGKDKVGMSRFF